MVDKQAVRAKYNELTEIVDSMRASGYTIERMWVEDMDGRVLVGRRPESEMHAIYGEPEAWIEARTATEERRALDEARRTGKRSSRR